MYIPIVVYIALPYDSISCPSPPLQSVLMCVYTPTLPSLRAYLPPHIHLCFPQNMHTYHKRVLRSKALVVNWYKP